MSPVLAIVPAQSGTTPAKSTGRDVFVSVTNGTKGPADGAVALEAPAGWSVTPASAPVHFDKEDESRSIKFVVNPPTPVKTGEYRLRAAFTSPATGAERFATGYQDIEYPHVQRRQVIKAADVALKVVDVKIAPNLQVGYVMGVGDQVPPAIEQLGARLTLIEPTELAWGELSKYDVIVTGVRAYERREDLRAYNRRLIDYAERAARSSCSTTRPSSTRRSMGRFRRRSLESRDRRDTLRWECSCRRIRCSRSQTRLGRRPGAGGRRSGGCTSSARRTPKYVDLIAMTDAFPDNPGEKLGSLVEARIGKGRWLYVGLGLWRQLPAGTVRRVSTAGESC